MLMHLLFFIGCNDSKIDNPDTGDSGIPLDTADDSDTADTGDDTDVVEVDPIEEGRTGTTICSAGGHVEGASISGSFCFGAVDISSSTRATSASFQWQPGPIYPVSP